MTAGKFTRIGSIDQADLGKIHFNSIQIKYSNTCEKLYSDKVFEYSKHIILEYSIQNTKKIFKIFFKHSKQKKLFN